MAGQGGVFRTDTEADVPPCTSSPLAPKPDVGRQLVPIRQRRLCMTLCCTKLCAQLTGASATRRYALHNSQQDTQDVQEKLDNDCWR